MASIPIPSSTKPTDPNPLTYDKWFLTHLSFHGTPDSGPVKITLHRAYTPDNGKWCLMKGKDASITLTFDVYDEIKAATPGIQAAVNAVITGVMNYAKKHNINL